MDGVAAAMMGLAIVVAIALGLGSIKSELTKIREAIERLRQ